MIDVTCVLACGADACPQDAELAAAMAADSAATASEAGGGGGGVMIAKAIKCTECGKLLRDTAAAEVWA